jgi:beta-lactamase class A
MQEITQLITAFPGTVGLYLHDLKTGEKFTHNQNISFPMASTYKIPILIQLFRDFEAGLLSLEDKISLQDKQTAPYSLLNLFSANTHLALQDLALMMIATSDNTATDIILEKVGIERVNAMLQAFEITPMLISHNTREGIKVISQKQNALEVLADKRDATTPLAMGILLEKLLRSEVASSESCAHIRKILSYQIRNARMPRKTSGFKNLQIAHKTGTTRFVTNDVGYLKLGERPEIILCLYTVKENDSLPTHVAEELIGDLTAEIIAYFESRE